MKFNIELQVEADYHDTMVDVQIEGVSIPGIEGDWLVWESPTQRECLVLTFGSEAYLNTDYCTEGLQYTKGVITIEQNKPMELPRVSSNEVVLTPVQETSEWVLWVSKRYRFSLVLRYFTI